MIVVASVVEGAITGAVVGLVVSLAMIWHRARWAKRFLAALEGSGAGPARVLLDQGRPAAAKLSLGKLLSSRERMAGLTLLGDVEALQAEVAGHTGPLTAVVQVGAVGLLGLTLRGSDRAAAARELDALATRMETEGGAMMKLVKQQTRALATLARCVADGRPVPQEIHGTVGALAKNGKLVEAVVYQAVLEATRAAGGDPRGLEAKVRGITTAFDGHVEAVAHPAAGEL